MAEQPEPILVRSLECLTVMVGDQQISLTLAKSAGDTVAEYLTDLFADFKRKVEEITDREFHAALGYTSLKNDTLKKIFWALYGVPYEKEAIWKGEWIDRTGAFALDDPTSTSNAKQAAKAGTSRSSRTTRTPTEV